MADFKTSMLGAYPTVQAAFAEMDASPDNIDAALDEEPLDIHEFIRGAATFQPPLSKEQAAFAFYALDTDASGKVGETEMVKAVEAGDFFETTTTATATKTTVTTSISRTSTTTPDPDTSTVTTITATSTTSTTITSTPKPDLPKPQIFHYLASSDEMPKNADDDMPLSAFWQIFHEETGVPLTWQGLPEYDFGLLDPNHDNSSVPEEFIVATQRFKTPLSKVQAEGVFYQLDANHDAKVEVREFESAIRDGHPGMVRPPVITHADYVMRLRNVTGSAGLVLLIDRVDISKLTDFIKNSIKRIVALSIADAADVSTDWIMDLEGNKGSVSLSAATSLMVAASSRRLLGENDVALEIKACIKARAGVSSEDVIAAVAYGKDRLAQDLSQVPSIRLAHGGDLSPTALRLVPFPAPVVSFMVSDVDGDQHLDRPEFMAVALEFKDAMSNAQADYAFSGLDANYDGKLSLDEYSGEATKDHFVVPPFMGRHIALEDFKARMASAYRTPQEAFDAMLAAPADINQFTKVAKNFRPPLTRDQAQFAFEGFDADHDGLLVNTEFLEVLRYGDFFPKVKDLQKMLSMVKARKWFSGFEEVPPSYQDTTSFAWSLALLLLIACAARNLALALHLPAAVGVVLASACVFHFEVAPAEFGAHAAQLQEQFQEVSQFMLLFATGLNLSVADLRCSIVTAAVLPATMELGALAAYGVYAMQLSVAQAVIVGAALFGVGDGRVAAKMHELGAAGPFRGHPAPRLALTRAPAEACFALLLWSSASGLMAQASRPDPDYMTLVFIGAARAWATIIVGIVVGYIGGIFLSMRGKVELCGRQLFTNAPEEAAFLALALGAAAHSLARLSTDGWMGLMGMGSEPSVQPQLLALVLGVVMARTMAAKDLEALDGSIGGMWVLGQLALFTLFGSELSPDAFSLRDLVQVFPMMCFGLASRLFGLLFVATATPSSCACPQCRRITSRSVCADAAFYFLASLQRTTIQAYLGSTASARAALLGVLGDPGAQSLMVFAARFYVLVLSSVGALLLDLLGPSLLRAGKHGERCESALALEEQLAAEGWTTRQRMMSGNSTVLPRKYFRIGLLSESGAVIESQACPALPLKEAVHKLAQAYMVDAAIFSDVLQKYADGRTDGEESTATDSIFGSSVPSGYASVRALPMYSGGESYAPMASQSLHTFRSSGADTSAAMTTGGALSFVKSRTTVRRLAQERLLTPRAYFEADGHVAMTSESRLKETGADVPVRL